MGASLWLKVIVPASLPMIVSGLKQGGSFAWRALMAGEVMSATIGLGQKEGCRGGMYEVEGKCKPIHGEKNIPQTHTARLVDYADL